MGKAKKATKKFIKNHLKDVITRRKKTQATNKKFAKRNSNTTSTSTTTPTPTTTTTTATVDETFKDMDVDSFLSGGFEAAASPNDDDSDSSEGEIDTELLVDERETEHPSDEDISDNEDIEEAETPDLTGDIAQHKKQLEELQEADPEFYKYLQENDQDLLDFDLSDEEDGEEEEEEEEEVGKEETVFGKDEEDEEAADDGSLDQTVTKEMIDRWQSSLEKNKSLRSLRRLLVAFSSAAHMDDAEKRDGGYKIDNASVFNKILVVTMKHTSAILDHHLPVQKNAEGSKKSAPLPSTSPKWKKLQPLVKSYLGNTLHILRQVTETNMLSFMVKNAEGSLPYFACFPKLGKLYLKALLDLWATAEDRVRIGSFLSLRQFAKLCPSPYLEMVLKGSYMSLVQACQSTTSYTLPTIQLLMNCTVELYGVDLLASYQQAFVYIRQLAIHLRSSLTVKSKDSYKAVYNWQFVHCLRFWARVIGSYTEDGKGPLDPLVYPLVQVCLGVIRLIPTSKYFPLRFHVIRSLIGLLKTTNVFIPLAPALLEVLDSAEMRRRPKPSTLKALDFSLHLKAPNNYLHTRAYQDGLLEQVVELFLEYATAYARSIAFPEIMTPAIVLLKRQSKKLKSMKSTKQVQQLVEKLEQNSKFITARRSRLQNVSPASLLASSSSGTLPCLEDQSVVPPLLAYFNVVNQVKEQREATLTGGAKNAKKEKSKTIEKETEDEDSDDDEDVLEDVEDVEDEDEDEDDMEEDEPLGDDEEDSEDEVMDWEDDDSS